MKPYKDVMSLLKWSESNEDDPLYHIAQKWITNQKADKNCILKGLQKLNEIRRSEVYQYNNFELTRIRSMLINSLTENDRCDSALIEHSLKPIRTFNLLDGVCLTISIVICLGIGWFQY